jgi:hypothetical protein
MNEEKRRVPRYSARLPATIKLPGEDPPVAVLVEDLGVLGCLLENGPDWEMHQECSFALTWNGREFQASAVIARRGEHGQVALEFRDIDPASQQMLQEVCTELLMRPLVRLSRDHR